MAIQILGQGSSSECSCQIDWDSTARNIGITVTGHATEFFVVVSGTFGEIIVDVLNGPPSATPDPETGFYKIGNVLGQGRVVVIGPGSVIGKNTPINSINMKSMSLGMRWTP